MPHPHGRFKHGVMYEIRDIIDESRTHYLIDWKDDVKTGKRYGPTWEPKQNANRLAVTEWKQRQKSAVITLRNESGEPSSDASMHVNRHQQQMTQQRGLSVDVQTSEPSTSRTVYNQSQTTGIPGHGVQTPNGRKDSLAKTSMSDSTSDFRWQAEPTISNPSDGKQGAEMHASYLSMCSSDFGQERRRDHGELDSYRSAKSTNFAMTPPQGSRQADGVERMSISPEETRPLRKASEPHLIRREPPRRTHSKVTLLPPRH